MRDWIELFLGGCGIALALQMGCSEARVVSDASPESADAAAGVDSGNQASGGSGSSEAGTMVNDAALEAGATREDAASLQDAVLNDGRECQYDDGPSQSDGAGSGLLACRPPSDLRAGVDLDRNGSVLCAEARGNQLRCGAQCAGDTDCTGGGTCRQGQCECPTQCLTDADCAGQEVCQCVVESFGGRQIWPEEVGNACIPSDCVDAADCGGRACGLSLGPCQYIEGYYCRTAQDECALNTDCPESQYCAFNETRGLWACQGQTPCD